MATQTTNLGLTKPDEAEGYDVNVFNANADAIDNAVGALQRTLGDGTGGGLGDKVDALQADVTAIKNATNLIGNTSNPEWSETVIGQIKGLASLLVTANQNIATLLTQNGGVKAIVNGQVTTPNDGNITFTIPNTMNADKVVILANYLASPNSTMHGVSWVRNGYTVNAKGQSGTVITYQLIEFY